MRPYEGTIAAAGTYTADLPIPQKRVNYITMQGRLDFGSAGGTSIKAYLQTSFDDGLTWRDVICLAFLAADASKVSAIHKHLATAAAQAGTDGALADDTIVDGTFGPKWRVKLIIVGAYHADNTFRLDIEPDYE